MSSHEGSRLLEQQSGARLTLVGSRFKDWGDCLCCGTLIAIAITFVAAIGWYVWQMPPLR